jgi:hypothetical protein
VPASAGSPLYAPEASAAPAKKKPREPISIAAAAVAVLIAVVVLVVMLMKPFDNPAGGIAEGQTTFAPETQALETQAPAPKDPAPDPKESAKASDPDIRGTWTLGSFVDPRHKAVRTDAFYGASIWLSDSASQESIENLRQSVEGLPGVEKVTYHPKEEPAGGSEATPDPALDMSDPLELYPLSAYIDVTIIDYAGLYGLQEKILALPELAGVVANPEMPRYSVSTLPTPVMTLTKDGKALLKVDPLIGDSDTVAVYEIDGDTLVLRYGGYEARLRFQVEGDVMFFLDYQSDLDLDVPIDPGRFETVNFFIQIDWMYLMQGSRQATLHRS